jgi:hypothetical protein
VFSRCIITDHCTGTLYFVKQNNNILRDVPTARSSHTDWIERRQLFNFTQSSPSNVWRVKHNLNSINLLLYVYTNFDGVLTWTPVTNYTTHYIDNNYFEIVFDYDATGELQCITHNNIQPAQALPDEYVKVTIGNILTVATHSHDTISYLPSIKVNGILRSDESNDGFRLGTNLPTLAWGDCNSVYMYGNNYNVSTINFQLNDPSNHGDEAFSIERVADGRLAVILLANSENLYDKIYDKIVDLNELRSDNNYIKNNELFCKQSIIRNCYPTIIQNQ